MTDWIARHRSSISFVLYLVLGTFLILYGTTIVGDSEPGLIALGAGAIGLPGYAASAQRDS